MAFVRTTVGKAHRISGTIAQVMTELSTVGVKPEQVIWYLDDNTDAECMFLTGV